MSMNELTLRRLIREEIEAALDEADSASAGPPKSWHEFRTMIADFARQAGAPDRFVEEVGDLENEGEGVPVALFNMWQDFQHEPSDNARDHWETFAYYASDAILNAAEQYKSKFNYSPSRRAESFNADGVAQYVEKLITSKHVFTKKS